MKAIYEGPPKGIPSDDEYLEGAREELESSIQEALKDLEPRLDGKSYVVINGVKFDARYITNLLFTMKLVLDGEYSGKVLEKMISNKLWACSECCRKVRYNLWKAAE